METTKLAGPVAKRFTESGVDMARTKVEDSPTRAMRPSEVVTVVLDL